MSSDIWTVDALLSSKRPLGGSVWRVVEAQNKVSTLKLVDNLDEQYLLEDLIEATKPKLPKQCSGLNFLLSSPFRYDAEYPNGSRFRRAGKTLGVFYASEDVKTAVAELCFYRLLFFSESPQTQMPANPGEYTAFSVEYKTDIGLDLMDAPLSDQSSLWLHPTIYGPCQDLADAARQVGVQAIRYESIRDPERGANLALLDCAVFCKPEPTSLQSWQLFLRRDSVQALREFPRLTLNFEKSGFNDPRL
ncbi:RES family NAD+ phosphorylase [Azospirillum sp. B21]|nr:RES family NAD+ phosphorylase [Azospirillum sp. B21]